MPEDVEGSDADGVDLDVSRGSDEPGEDERRGVALRDDGEPSLEARGAASIEVRLIVVVVVALVVVVVNLIVASAVFVIGLLRLEVGVVLVVAPDFEER